ncbi:MAG TPA: class I SAM-dependent methyltransferase [Acidimicrobiales bacterium]|nr:class I SAM-dependent methyltransferase [Acidimicrobiales bacterium]
MPDVIFAHPRLAEVYDDLDGVRDDLDLYVAIAEQERSSDILDLGCGTGTLACRLAGLRSTPLGAARSVGAVGHELSRLTPCRPEILAHRVVGLDPAAASLAVARRKPHAELVRWIEANAADPDLERLVAHSFDLVVMTGNVAQVFLDDAEWAAVLANAYRLLRPGGRLVFEARRPEAEAWRTWTKDRTYRRLPLPGSGRRRGEDHVTTWTELSSVQLPLISFRQHFVFERGPETLISDSTLVFRGEAEIVDQLEQAGFAVKGVRQAPDRPGLEMVFVARAASAAARSKGRSDLANS